MWLTAIFAFGRGFLGFLGSIPLRVWLIIAAVCVIAFAGLQTWQVEKLKDKVAELRKDLRDPKTKKLWKDLAQECHAAIAAQNAQIEAARQQGQAALDKSERALAVVRLQRDSSNKRLQSILGAKAGPDVCKSADELILGTVK